MPPKRMQRRRPYDQPSASCEHTDRSTSDRSDGATELVCLDSGNGGDQAGTCNPFVNLLANRSTASNCQKSGIDMQSVVFDLPQTSYIVLTMTCQFMFRPSYVQKYGEGNSLICLC